MERRIERAPDGKGVNDGGKVRTRRMKRMRAINKKTGNLSLALCLFISV